MRQVGVRLYDLELQSVWVRIILAQLPITLISIELTASITKINEEAASGPVTEWKALLADSNHGIFIGQIANQWAGSRRKYLCRPN